MAGPLHDAESCLPAQFLTEDDVLFGKETLKGKGLTALDTELLLPSYGFPNEFPYEFDSLDSSALSSPVVSVGSTETDSSDEDEFFLGLSRRLSRSSSQKLAVPSFYQDKTEKSGVMASSPQSTLSGIGSWSVSSNGSPNGPSQAPSPPTTPFGAQNDAWDLIYEAAGQVARLKVSGEAPKCNHNGHHGRALPRTQNQSLAKNPISGLYSNPSLAHNPFQANQFQHARQDQVPKSQCGAVWGRQVRPSWQAQSQYQQTQLQSRARSTVGCCESVRSGRPLGLPLSSWPTVQAQSQRQQHSTSSGMRAVFLGGSGGVKRECVGTGVFLPRRYGNPPENRKKSGCSTVLLPAKVVQALNLNLDELHAQPHMTPGFALNHDAMMARRNAALLSQQKKLSYRQEALLNQELRLPQDWTY
ncbi:hypothetical protein SLE2022_071130 [Rubroshorea leprosula]